MLAGGHARPSDTRLPRFHERWVYAIFFGLWISGALWLVFHYFLPVQGTFGVEPHPLEAWWLRVHGAMAMAFLVVLGTLLPIHIRRGWRLRRNVTTAIPLLLLIVGLIATGYGLYYAGSEALRPWISLIHWIAGLASGLVLVIHVSVGKQKIKRLRAR